jgi:hypothetical protein
MLDQTTLYEMTLDETMLDKPALCQFIIWTTTFLNLPIAVRVFEAKLFLRWAKRRFVFKWQCMFSIVSETEVRKIHASKTGLIRMSLDIEIMLLNKNLYVGKEPMWLSTKSDS